jgi:hypothetical protein
MNYSNSIHLKDMLPEHDRLILRHHPDLKDHLDGLPVTWRSALQDPGDPGKAAARIWQPIQKMARGMVFRLENITLDLGLVVSDRGSLPPYLIYICNHRQALHGWLAGTPAGEDEIKAFEERLGIRLPSSYQAFMQIHNGFFDTTRPETGLFSLKQSYLIKFSEMDEQAEQGVRLLAFSTDRVGQVHTYNLNVPNGKGDYSTGIWDIHQLKIGQLKSFWSYLKDFSIHSLL